MRHTIESSLAGGTSRRRPADEVPPRQAVLRARCIHRSGVFEPFPREATEQSIPARFGQIVRRHPDRLAVRTDTHSLTYEALERTANRIAHAVLDRRGPGPEPIALLMEKDAPLIAAEVGLLKAGKIFAPLDPSFPEARLASLLADCQAPLVLTTARHRALAATLAGDRIEVLDVEALDPRVPSDDPGLALGPDALGYLLYTSGSTGQPKGVVFSHRGLLDQARRHTNALHVGAEDRVTVMGSMSAGQSLTQVFVPLLNGAAVFPRDLKEHGLATLAPWLNREGITYYRSSASIFRHWAEHLTGAETFPTLRLVGLSSESVYRQDFELYRRLFGPDCLFLNALSSTETGTFCLNVLDRDTPVEGRLVPVGYPVDGVEVLLLDETGARVAAGDVGEIAVRSRNLARGYWRQEELTRTKFRPDPDDTDVRTYVVGDLGRLDPDGALVHLGRRDSRVKVRGHRIELGEVEAALRETDGIREAVVVDREDHRGEKRLVAYVVADGEPPARATLRRALKGRLPEHMIPFAFSFLDGLPRTPGGKVDRPALPPFAPPVLQPSRPWLVPLGLLGTQIGTIWEDLLGVTGVGPHDDFLELGGDSLTAIEMLARIEDVCGRAIAPSRLVEGGITIERLVGLLVEGERASWVEPVTALRAEGSRPPLFFVHGDFEHGGFYCHRLARELGPDQPFYSVTPHGLDGGPLPWSIEAMAADRLAAIRAIRPTGPYRLGGFCNGGVIAFEMARQLERLGESVEVLLLIDSRALNAPPGYRLASRATRWIARALGWSEASRRALYLRLRLFDEAFRDSARPGGGGRARFVLRKVRAVSGRVRATAASHTGGGEIGEQSTLFPAYGARLRDYVPGRYAGRVALFRSSHLDDKPPGGPTAGWRHVAGHVDVHPLPGSHLLAVTRHVEVLADKMRPYLG
jgi:amino acid adenylation domain-containing protein